MRKLLMAFFLFIVTTTINASDLVCQITNKSLNIKSEKTVLPLVSDQEEAINKIFADVGTFGLSADDDGNVMQLMFVPVLTSLPGGLISTSLYIFNTDSDEIVQKLPNLSSHSVQENVQEDFKLKDLTLNLGSMKIIFSIACKSLGKTNFSSPSSDGARGNTHEKIVESSDVLSSTTASQSVQH